MITTVSFEKIKSEYKLEFVNSTKISLFGGLPTFVSFLERASLRERLTEVVGAPSAKVMLQIMLGSLLGARSMEEVALLSKDKVVKDFVGSPLSATRIVRVLKKLSKPEIQGLHELALSNGLLDMASCTDKDAYQTIDIDATACEKYGQQEGVAFGYVDGDEVKKCYQYLIVRNDAMNTIMYGTIRDGSTHSQNNFCGYLEMILPMFDGRWRLRIRADSGYFNEQAFDLCHQNNVHFFVKAPMSETRVAQALSPHLHWQVDADDPSVEYATRQTVTRQKTLWNELFRRVANSKSENGYSYACIATNDLNAKAPAAYNFYNGRANIENINSELKGDLGLGSITTKWFDVNDVITQSIIILYQMLSHFKRTCLDKADQDKRAATIRDSLFKVPAEILRSSRYEWLRVYTQYFDGLTYARIFSRIKELKNIFVLAYQLRSG